MPRRPPGEGRLIQLVYYGYVAGSALARALPERFVYGVADALGTLWARRAKKKRAVVARNLARVTGEAPGPRLDSLVDDAFRSYARYWLETFRFVREGKEFFLERVRGKGEGNLDLARAEGRGVVVAVGHLGNWDAAGAWAAATGRKLVTVAEVLKPRRMFDFFVDHRSRLGMTIYGAERGVTDKLVDEVRDGAVIAILGDRDLKGTGPVVEFFGSPVPFPAGPASVALRAGVPLLVAGVWGITLPDGRRGWEADISGPIEIPGIEGMDSKAAIERLTQEVATRMEELVARKPEDWHVFQPFWPADKRPARGTGGT